LASTRLESAIERVGGIGYRWLGDMGVTGREAFDPPLEPGSMGPA